MSERRKKGSDDESVWLEDDREYNAELVHQRDAALERVRQERDDAIAALNRANAATTRAEQERDTLCTALHALSARWRTWADDPSHAGVFLAGAILATRQCADDLDAILTKTELP